MPISRATESITADDETIRTALEDAILPALLPALAQATGDFSLLREDLQPALAIGDAQGGLTAEQQATARSLALDAIKKLRDGGASDEQRPIEDDVRRISQWLTSSAASDDYITLCVEELAVSGEDPRAPTWHAENADFRVAIIGAGMSGILAGIRLQQAGVPFVIIEKNEDVGGTWLENTYPGARVDIQSAFYSYSFAQKTDWPNFFSPQSVLLDYFRDCADEQGIRDQIRFNTEVRSATFDEDTCTWAVRLQPADGDEETIEVQAVITAVGQLNRPKMPDIEGLESFKGPSFHSAQWDHSVGLKAKRIAVIGTGASAAQFVPEIAEDAEAVSVFQRTPAWFLPIPNYQAGTPDGLQWLFRHVPHYMHWYRFWLFWTTTDGALPMALADEGWQPQDRSVSAANDQLRQMLTMYLQAQYADRPDLLEKALPTYPPAAKRMLLDNGSWAQTLKRDDVDLITEGIQKITPEGVVTEDGNLFEADVIVYGTGFHASEFLMPMKVTGRRGIELEEQWDGDARAYLGITVPNFPNFFMIYGPNTNIVVNGSIIYFSECGMQYVMGCLRLLIKDRHRALECKQDVHDAYNERIDAANLQRAWGVSDVNSWYKNEHGRVAQNWPFNLVEYWQQTREPNPEDYVFL